MTIWLANAVAAMVVVFGSMLVVAPLAFALFGLFGAAIYAHELWELRKK